MLLVLLAPVLCEGSLVEVVVPTSRVAAAATAAAVSCGEVLGNGGGDAFDQRRVGAEV